MIRATSLLALAILASPASAQLTVNKPALVMPAPPQPATSRNRPAPAVPTALAPGQAGILVAFHRPDRMSDGKSGALAFARYDVDKRELIPEPRGAKKAGTTTTYNVLAKSTDRKAPIEHALFLVTPGDFVLAGASPGPGGQVFNSFCLSAPTFRVNEGEIAYFGAITPYVLARMKDGTKASAMAYSADIDAAWAALASYPALQKAIMPANIRNDASWGCFATEMLAYAVPGAPYLPPLDPKAVRGIPTPPPYNSPTIIMSPTG